MVKTRQQYSYLNDDILQQLIVEGVGAVELEHEVTREDVLDAAHHVLGLRLWKKIRQQFVKKIAIMAFDQKIGTLKRQTQLSPKKH